MNTERLKVEPISEEKPLQVTRSEWKRFEVKRLIGYL